MPGVTFSFDPACPWTWRASRWLVEVAPVRDLDIEWATFSLAIVNEGEIPDEHKARFEASRRALRLIEALRAEGRNDDVGRFYTELGTRAFGADGDRADDFDDGAVIAAAEAAGVDDVLGALDDESLDDAVRASHDAAFAAAGPDIGSPVLQIEGLDRGLHGPILDAVPRRADALELWDAVATLMAAPHFFEVKRGR
jgi:2-hydroxychromene-2-carboxylate isomerase